MLPQNLKVNSPIVLTKLVAPRTLAILIDKDDHALLRILDCSTQMPLKTYKKVFNNTQGSHYYSCGKLYGFIRCPQKRARSYGAQ